MQRPEEQIACRGVSLTLHGPQRVTTRPEKIMSELVNTSEVVIPAVPNKNGKINLLDLNRQQMREFFKEMGENRFVPIRS